MVWTVPPAAALEVAAALILAAWGWADLRRQHGDLAVYLVILLVGHAATACLFLFGGRRDRRTWLLGVYFLLKATLVNPFMLLEFVRGMPPADPFGYPDFARPYVYPFLFAPACLWAFARECPRVHRWTRLDELARRMVRVSAAVGCLAWAGSVAWVELARTGRVDREHAESRRGPHGVAAGGHSAEPPRPRSVIPLYDATCSSTVRMIVEVEVLPPVLAALLISTLHATLRHYRYLLLPF